MQCRDTNRNRHIDFLVFILNNEMIDCFKDLTDKEKEIVYDGPADQVDQAVLDAIYQGKQEEPA